MAQSMGLRRRCLPAIWRDWPHRRLDPCIGSSGSSAMDADAAYPRPSALSADCSTAVSIELDLDAPTLTGGPSTGDTYRPPT